MKLSGGTRPIIIALASVGAAVAVRAPLESLLGGTQVWLTFWPAVFVAAWFGGFRAGLMATALATGVVWLWLVPRSVLELTNATIGSVVFVICSTAFAGLAEKAARARREERRLRDVAEAARREAQEANRAKDEFLAVLGHELRNPLAPIGSATTLLRLRVPESHELDIIERQVNHMSRLVDDLLDVSRIVRGQLELQRTVVDLAAIVEKAIEMVQPHRARSGHRIDVEVEQGHHVDADPHRLVQVLTNLLVNAMKYSKPEAPITVSAQREGEMVRLTIRDRGVGMDAAMLARAFEPFAQGAQESDRAAGGLGLGLAIARRLVELHGGSLTARSAVGEGTDVVVLLPLSHAPATTAIETVKPSEPTQQRVLIVDDNTDAANMLGMLMETRGHEVRIAYDGPSALELLDDFAPTLALLDIGLPGMDGHELVRRMRERGITSHIVALTGYGRDSDRARALAAGFDDHLVKPVELARIDELLQMRAA